MSHPISNLFRKRENEPLVSIENLANYRMRTLWASFAGIFIYIRLQDPNEYRHVAVSMVWSFRILAL
jgi:hypothetical protein